MHPLLHYCAPHAQELGDIDPLYDESDEIESKRGTVLAFLFSFKLVLVHLIVQQMHTNAHKWIHMFWLKYCYQGEANIRFREGEAEKFKRDEE
jgi:hypothetical protein